MNVLIINHNGGSLYHGPNLRTYYAGKELLGFGHLVTIVSSSYSHKYSMLPTTNGTVTNENIDGIQYRWIRCIKYKNLFQRVYSHFEFGYKLLANRRKICGKVDLIIFSGPPPDIFLFSWVLSKIMRASIVSDVRDLWPRTQLEMNSWQWLNPYTYFLFFYQFLLVTGSSRIVSPLPGISEYILKINKKRRVVIIENGFDLRRKNSSNGLMLKVMAVGKNLNQYRNDYISLDEIRKINKFFVGYSGAFDRDNDLDSILEAAKRMSNRDDVVFMFVGDGVRRDFLLNAANSLPNVMVFSRVSSRDVPTVISVMDVCYCGLKPKKIYQFGVSLAKSFEYMASGKPILWMVDAFNNPVRESGGGFEIEAGNPLALVDAIEQCASMSKNDLIAMGRKSYSFIEKNHSYDVLGQKWGKLVDEFDISIK
jgi:glycosyltransferase involved in cell wall biosynthesis